MKFKTLLLFGAPGAGKGTIGHLLALAGEHCHVSSGDIFRGLSQSSPGGKLFHEYASKGQLVPDDVTVEVWKRYMEGLIATNRFFPETQHLILDGIPRTQTQAELLDRYVDVERVVVLEANDLSVFVERLKNRARIQNRVDDAQEEVLAKRMDVYTKQTKDVLQHYAPENVKRIDASGGRIEVLKSVIDVVSDLL